MGFFFSVKGARAARATRIPSPAPPPRIYITRPVFVPVAIWGAAQRSTGGGPGPKMCHRDGGAKKRASGVQPVSAAVGFGRPRSLAGAASGSRAADVAQRPRRAGGEGRRTQMENTSPVPKKNLNLCEFDPPGASSP